MVLREVDGRFHDFSGRVIKSTVEIKKRKKFYSVVEKIFKNKIQNKNVNP